MAYLASVLRDADIACLTLGESLPDSNAALQAFGRSDAPRVLLMSSQRHASGILPDVLEDLLNRFVGEPPPATAPRRHALYAVRVHPAISRRVALQDRPMLLVPINQSRTVLLVPQAIGPGNTPTLDVES